MSKQIFVNVAVNNLQKSFAFYTAIGFNNNPMFSDETSKCMVWSDTIFLMLMTKEKFSSFVKKPIADTIAHVSSLYALSLDSTDEVNKIVENGLKNGGIEPTAARDYGFMQQRTIEDFDGHTWEFFYMDVSQFPAAQ